MPAARRTISLAEMNLDQLEADTIAAVAAGEKIAQLVDRANNRELDATENANVEKLLSRLRAALPQLREAQALIDEIERTRELPN